MALKCDAWLLLRISDNMFVKKIKSALAYFFGLWVLVAICLQTWGVFSRNILSMSTAWVDDIQRMNFIWLIWVLAAFAYAGAGLISLDLIEVKLAHKPRAREILLLVQAVFELALGLFFAYLAFNIIKQQFIAGEVTSYLGIPLWIINLGMLIGCALLFVFSIRKVIVTIISTRKVLASQ